MPELQAQSKCRDSIVRVNNPSDVNQIRSVFNEYGAVVLKDFFKGDPIFEKYVHELKWLALSLMAKLGIQGDESAPLETLVSQLFQQNPKAPIPLYHLGTQPIQLVVGNQLKYSDRCLKIARAILGESAILGSPSASDSLIGFPPGREFERVLLPIHEDFPYLLQSSRQITFWLSLSPYVEGVGGIDLWLGTHKNGLYRSKKLESGHYEAEISQEQLARFSMASVNWDFADLVIMDAHLLHRGCPNRTLDRTRIVQLFRYTDLRDPKAIEYFWKSKVFPRSGTDIVDVEFLYL